MKDEKKTLERIKNDIFALNNWDSYLTLICAFIAAVLGSLNFVSETIVYCMLLITMALISFSLINHRFIIEDFYKMLSSKGTIRQSFPEDFNKKIETAKEIWITGIHHSSFMTDYHNSLERMLEKGGELYVMLADPDGHAINMTSLRFPNGKNPEVEKQRTEDNLEAFKKLKKNFPNNVEIKIMDYLFEYSCVFINGNSSKGEAFLQRYTFRTKGGARKPKIIYKQTDGEWYTLIKKEVQSFLECGTLIHIER